MGLALAKDPQSCGSRPTHPEIGPTTPSLPATPRRTRTGEARHGGFRTTGVHHDVGTKRVHPHRPALARRSESSRTAHTTSSSKTPTASGNRQNFPRCPMVRIELDRLGFKHLQGDHFLYTFGDGEKRRNSRRSCAAMPRRQRDSRLGQDQKQSQPRTPPGTPPLPQRNIRKGARQSGGLN